MNYLPLSLLPRGPPAGWPRRVAIRSRGEGSVSRGSTSDRRVVATPRAIAVDRAVAERRVRPDRIESGGLCEVAVIKIAEPSTWEACSMRSRSVTMFIIRSWCNDGRSARVNSSASRSLKKPGRKGAGCLQTLVMFECVGLNTRPGKGEARAWFVALSDLHL